MTYRDFENIQRSNEEFDGLVVLLSLWAYDNHASYHLHNWDPMDDERMMMAIYYAEQVHPFPRYKNDLAKFKADWAAQAYDPGGASLTFAPADVEELEVLCEEAAEPEPEPPAPPAPKRKKHKRRRRGAAGGKTEETKRLERAIWKATNKQGVFGCFEVTIGWFGKERIDYMTYDTKGVFRCYEIKVTKTDFHSHCHNSFVGDLNYYVLPADLYEEVKEEIPDFVGAYIERDGIVYSIRRARRRMVEDPDTLKNSMIRSLCREVTKQIRSGDTLYIEATNREISQLKRECDNLRRKYWDLLREVQELYGTRWNKGGNRK